MCEEEKCRGMKFIVYKDEISLKSHYANVHKVLIYHKIYYLCFSNFIFKCFIDKKSSVSG